MATSLLALPRRGRANAAALAGAALALGGCAALPADALKLRPDSYVNRAVQTRAFGAAREADVLTAAAGVLQDLGFTLDESETTLGLIVATNEASAMNQVDTALSLLNRLTTFGLGNDPYTKRQVIRASLVLRPARPGAGREPTVRATFQRRVYNAQNLILTAEPLNDPHLYQEFYARLGQSVFLETSAP